MKAILVFIDGTICDGRGRYSLLGTPEFNKLEMILSDRAVDGSVNCLNSLSQRYEIVYIGARPESTQTATTEWLNINGYPKGDVYLAENQVDRLSLVKAMNERYDFLVGIGDRWDDNELHAELGCLSIILEEHAGRWDTVAERVDRHQRRTVIEANQTRLEGKIEGLTRVCPLLLSKFGEQLWTAYQAAVLELAENTRDERRAEELASFAECDLDPSDLRDAAKWDELLREQDWENNPLYGLQSFELVEATKYRYVHKVTYCYYANLWKKHEKADIGYHIHCRTDSAWWDRPAWNPLVRFEQPKTLMQGDEYCLFIQTIPDE